MSLKIGISMTAYRRTEYLSQVLDSLKKAMAYAQYPPLQLYLSIDYFDDHITNMISNIDWIKIHYVINNPPMGCNKNTKNAMLMALSANDAIIHLEDDTLLSIDAIEYFIKHLNNTEYRQDPNIISIGGYNQTNELDPAKLHNISLHNDFICWGIAFWKHKVNMILNNWTPLVTRTHDYESWDTHINRVVFGSCPSYMQIRPDISRIRNIGATNGTYTTAAAMIANMDPETWHNTFQSTKYISEDLLDRAQS